MLNKLMELGLTSSKVKVFFEALAYLLEVVALGAGEFLNPISD